MSEKNSNNKKQSPATLIATIIVAAAAIAAVVILLTVKQSRETPTLPDGTPLSPKHWFSQPFLKYK